jgi:hypothetical protein
MKFCQPGEGLAKQDQGWQNVGRVSRGSGAQRNNLDEWNPGATEGSGAYTDLMRRFAFFLFHIYFR